MDASDLDINAVTSNWRIKANVWIISIGLIILPLFSHAGGLGMAPLAAIIGGMGLATTAPSALMRIPRWVMALGAFLLWSALTSFWTPYEDTQSFTNPWKILVGAVLYLGTILSVKQARLFDRDILDHMVIAMTILTAGLLIIDILSGYALTFLVDPLNSDETLGRKIGDIIMNLGHSITVIAVMMPLVMVLLYRHFPMGWLLAIIFAVVVAISAILGELSIGLLSVLASLIAMGLASAKPILTLRLLIWTAILSILLFPFLAYGFGFVSDEFKAMLPFSWEHRLEMWPYTADKILESPIWGHGFDAARTFDDTFSSRGIKEWPIVSLHPHNAGLHIWVETGLIGASLASVSILMMGNATEQFIMGSRMRAIAVCGLLASVIVISNVTFGVWQDWWWGTIIFAAALIRLIPRN